MRLLMIPVTRIMAGILFALTLWVCIADSGACADEAFDSCIDFYSIGAAADDYKDHGDDGYEEEDYKDVGERLDDAPDEYKSECFDCSKYEDEDEYNEEPNEDVEPEKSFAGSDLWDDNTHTIPLVNITKPENLDSVYQYIEKLTNAEPTDEKRSIEIIMGLEEDILSALILLVNNGNEDFMVDKQIRLGAICILGKMEQKAKPAIPALLWALRDYDKTVVKMSEAALAAIDPEHAGEYVRAAREDMARAAWWAWYFKHTRDKKDLPALLKALDHWHLNVRRNAISAIVEIGADASLAPALLAALNHDDWFIREQAVRALVGINPPPQELLPELLRLLEITLEDTGQYGFGSNFYLLIAAFKLDPDNPRLQKLLAELFSSITDAPVLFALEDEDAFIPAACDLNPGIQNTMPGVFKLMENAPFDARQMTGCLFQIADCGMFDTNSSDYKECLSSCYDLSLEDLTPCFAGQILIPNKCEALLFSGDAMAGKYDYPAAEKQYQASRECFIEKNLGQEDLFSLVSIQRLALIREMMGDYEGQMLYAEKSLEIARRTFGEQSMESSLAYMLLSSAYLKKGDFDLAIETLFNMELEDTPENKMLFSLAYSIIGQAFLEKGNGADALEWFQEAAAYAAPVPNETFVPVQGAIFLFINIFIARAYTSMGDFDAALEVYNLLIESTSLGFTEEQNPYIGQIRAGLGKLHADQGQWEQAALNYQAALDLNVKMYGENHRETARPHFLLGEVFEQSGAADKALEQYEKARAGLCGGEPDALTSCRIETLTVQIYHALARLNAKTGAFDTSARMYSLAAQALNMLRAELQSPTSKKRHAELFYEMFPEGIGVFEELSAKSGDAAFRERACEFAEAGIGRVFLEMIGKSQAQIYGGLPPEAHARRSDLIKRLQQAQARVDSAENAFKPPIKVVNFGTLLANTEFSENTEFREAERNAAYVNLASVERELESFETDLLEKYPEYAALMNPQPRPLAEIRDVVLAPGEAALEYYLGEEASWLIFITHDKIRIEKLPPAGDIEYMVGKLRRQLTIPQVRRELRTQAADLYDTLIAPVENDLTDIGKLLIVPTGNLYFLPFETLLKGAEYLVQRYDIRYAPSLNVVYMTARRHGAERDGNWLGFGDPVYETQDSKDCNPSDSRARGTEYSEDTAMAMRTYTRGLGGDDEERGAVWCRIPGTGVEVRAIETLFESGGVSPDVFIDQDATEGNFKAEARAGHRFVHVASHGTLGTSGKGDARQPALVLSLFGNEESGDDGFLTMTEVFNMKTPADMVVLSACETGRGQMEMGEGVAGMSRAFLYAGADSLVVSLWSVADAQTKDLMVRFYEKILSGEDRQSALTATKREFIEKGLAPYYWAPFIYIGVN